MMSDNPIQNPRFLQEEEFMLQAIGSVFPSDQTSFSTENRGLVPLYDFFCRYLPPMVAPAMGRIGFPNCEVSRPIDILILDSRYPLLSFYPDGLVIAPLHSVLAAIAVIPTLTLATVAELKEGIDYVNSLASPLLLDDGSMKCAGFVYRSDLKLSEIESSEQGQKNSSITIMRFSQENQGNESLIGYVDGAVSPNPLDVFYSDLVRDLFRILAIRQYDQDGLQSRLALYKDWPSFGNEREIQGLASFGSTSGDDRFGPR
jgi:hypothetical protein